MRRFCAFSAGLWVSLDAPYRRRRYGLFIALSPKAIRAFVALSPEAIRAFVALSPEAIRAFVGRRYGLLSPYRRRRYGLLSPYRRRRYGLLSPYRQRRYGLLSPYRRRRYGLFIALSPKAIRAHVSTILPNFKRRALLCKKRREKVNRRRTRVRRTEADSRLGSPSSFGVRRA